MQPIPAVYFGPLVVFDSSGNVISNTQNPRLQTGSVNLQVPTGSVITRIDLFDSGNRGYDGMPFVWIYNDQAVSSPSTLCSCSTNQAYPYCGAYGFGGIYGGVAYPGAGIIPAYSDSIPGLGVAGSYVTFRGQESIGCSGWQRLDFTARISYRALTCS